MVDQNPSYDFQEIRDSLRIPRDFPADTLEAARIASSRDPLQLRISDAQNIPFLTIDPPGSMDLDQAFFASRDGSGYTVAYAIDDIGFFVDRGSIIENAAFERGCTLYSPDIKTPLYPPILSEDAASLLPGKPRAAIVYTFSLNERAEVTQTGIARAIIRSRAQLTYPDVSAHLDAERSSRGSGPMAGLEWSESLTLLEEIGRKRQTLEAERHAVNLRIPVQQVERWTTALFGYRLAFEEASDVEEWNAQISLMTGIEAARIMISHQVGILRTLEPPRADRLMMLRLTARALGVEWPPDVEYGDFIRSLDPREPLNAVIIHQAARLNGGARYLAFSGELPKNAGHAGLASYYAHTTAPLRRLVDRYVLDLLVELTGNSCPNAAEVDTLQRLPQVMMDTDRRAKQLESEIVDFAEARLMEDRVGDVFTATVIGVRSEGPIVQIADPPIRTLVPSASFLPPGAPRVTAVISDDGSTLKIDGLSIELGNTIALKLVRADVKARRLEFEPASR